MFGQMCRMLGVFDFNVNNKLSLSRIGYSSQARCPLVH